ncbi:MAG: redoxin domain-containing protein [Gemmatimonadaceae bacterium]|nr:redoxin domain-containing protein [Gemmatimonadaceae bacterium]
MNAYRDQYAQTFSGGRGVTILAISADPDTTQANWAREAGYPMTFVSDTAKVAGRAYAVLPAGGSVFQRVVFVVGKDGRVAHVMRPFRELVQDSYDELADAVRKAAGAR